MRSAMRRAVLVLTFLLPTADPASAVTRAFTCTSDFSTGGLSVADVATRGVSIDVATIHSDAVPRWYGGLLYVVGRFGADHIQVLDPAQGYATLRQFSVGNGSNPQDIAFVSPTKAYVSRYGSADLLVVNPSAANGQPMQTISLGAFADGDGLPEMTRMIRIGRHLFVACQRLTSFQPSNVSMVVVVDTQADTVVDANPALPGRQAISLVLRNPATAFDYDRVGGRLLIGCAGQYGALDGGIEAIDPFQFQSLGTAITESELGGDVADVAWLSAARSYALVSQASVNRLVSWNPATGLKLGTPYTANGGFSLPDMELSGNGELYVCKNPGSPSPTDPPGLLVFATANDALLAGPLGTGLPPIAVTFDHVTDEVTAAPAPVPASPLPGLAAPVPNPARLRARIAFRLDVAGPVDLAVFDLVGRRVRTLAAGSFGAGSFASDWDLANEHGRPVAAGLYLVRAITAAGSSVRRITVLR